MRWLDEMNTETYLITHCPGWNPEGSFFTCHLCEVVLEGINGGIASFVVHVIFDGGIYDCLAVR